MERAEISLHEVKVVACLIDAGGWMSNSDIAAATKMPNRTVRSHTKRLVTLGIFDVAEVFPAHRYRFSKQAEKRNKSYYQRLQQASEVFGIKTTLD